MTTMPRCLVELSPQLWSFASSLSFEYYPISNRDPLLAVSSRLLAARPDRVELSSFSSRDPGLLGDDVAVLAFTIFFLSVDTVTSD
jgi:hypothetical protein